MNDVANGGKPSDLFGWEAIAYHFPKQPAVSTVRGWEKSGMPVRHRGQSKWARVEANTEELDAWYLGWCRTKDADEHCITTF